MSASIELFFSYSHKDEALRDALATHLSNLEWQGVITSWHDRKLVAGTEWDDEIKTQLDSADIILLLISPDFIASRYCREVEIPQAMQRHEAGKACVVPVILRPFDWQSAPFAKLQAYPKDAKAVTLWTNQDEAFVSVTQGIRIAAEQMQVLRQQQAQKKDIARSQYKKKVEEVLSDGKISSVERDTLDELQKELDLTAGEAEAIEATAFEPYRRYEEHLERYRQTLLKVIEREYPISEATQADLKLRQRDLGLKPEDVERIEQPILADAAQRHAAAPPDRPAPQIQPLLTPQPPLPPSDSPPRPPQTTSVPSMPIAPVRPNPTPTYTPPNRLPKQAAIGLGAIGLLGAVVVGLSMLDGQEADIPIETGNSPAVTAPAPSTAEGDDASTDESEDVPTPIAYQRPDGLFAIAFPEGYTYEETENGVSFASGDGGFMGSVEVLSAQGQRFTTQQLEDRLKQSYGSYLKEVNWQDTTIRAVNKIRVDWIGRDQEGRDLDAVTYMEQHGDNIFTLNMAGVNKPANDYYDEWSAIQQSFAPQSQ